MNLLMLFSDPRTLILSCAMLKIMSRLKLVDDGCGAHLRVGRGSGVFTFSVSVLFHVQDAFRISLKYV